jgi:hypothetical protein
MGSSVVGVFAIHQETSSIALLIAHISQDVKGLVDFSIFTPMVCSSRWDNNSTPECPIIVCHHLRGVETGFLKALLGFLIKNVDRDEEEGARA